MWNPQFEAKLQTLKRQQQKEKISLASALTPIQGPAWKKLIKKKLHWSTSHIQNKNHYPVKFWTHYVRPKTLLIQRSTGKK